MDDFVSLTCSTRIVDFRSDKFVNYICIQWMIESNIMHDFCLHEESCDRVLSFLYDSFKTNKSKIICLALAYSIHHLLKKQPLDNNISRLLKDLNEKCQSSNEYALLTYGKLIETLYIKTTDLSSNLISFENTGNFDSAIALAKELIASCNHLKNILCEYYFNSGQFYLCILNATQTAKDSHKKHFKNISANCILFLAKSLYHRINKLT
ncbi:hypothetical protein MXB_5269 [Myxobolus squamalis]|nr:hypothetical protein MXB_5269 [Myxobolus squamalis]